MDCLLAFWSSLPELSARALISTTTNHIHDNITLMNNPRWLGESHVGQHVVNVKGQSVKQNNNIFRRK
jgi:hypothetical protein